MSLFHAPIAALFSESSFSKNQKAILLSRKTAFPHTLEQVCNLVNVTDSMGTVTGNCLHDWLRVRLQ